MTEPTRRTQGIDQVVCLINNLIVPASAIALSGPITRDLLLGPRSVKSGLLVVGVGGRWGGQVARNGGNRDLR